MKKLRLLAVSFDTHISPWELKQFRGAVSQKVGLEHEWFHNHDNSGEEQDSPSYGRPRYHHRYPLIQYNF